MGSPLSPILVVSVRAAGKHRDRVLGNGLKYVLEDFIALMGPRYIRGDKLTHKMCLGVF